MILYMSLIETESDRSKFKRLYEEYHRLMFCVAKDILGNDSDAEDAVQEAFLKIVKNLNKINDFECHKTKLFIVIIVRRKAIDILRQKSMHDKVVSLNESSLEDRYEDENALEQIENTIDKLDLENAIAGLPDRYRDAIMLKYYYSFSDAEIAETLATTETNVRKLLERAKVKLADLYKKGGMKK